MALILETFLFPIQNIVIEFGKSFAEEQIILVVSLATDSNSRMRRPPITNRCHHDFRNSGRFVLQAF